MVKIVAVCIVMGILILYLKSINSELAMLATICGGIIILIEASTYFSEILTFINNLIEKSNIDKELFIIIFKIIGIGYLIEFGATTLDEFGLRSLADKLVLVGKIIILSMSIPLFYAIFNLVAGLFK